MSETSNSVVALRYRGNNSRYVDIAVRGTDEHLGIGVQYALHPNGVGCFIVRFVVHGAGVDPKNYKHLMYRESAKFVVEQTATTSAELIKGVRLNKIAIPVFEPAVRPHELDKFALKFGIWNLLEEWVAEQVQAEGFTLQVDLQKELRRLIIGDDTPEDGVKSVISFPDLNSPEVKQQALKLVKKPLVEEDEDEDEQGDEEDDEAEKKDWMN